jgi:hypothetical protein
MRSFEQRIAAYAAASANLVTQLKELDQLRERVRKAQLSRVRPKRLKQRPASVNRRPRYIRQLAPISSPA